MKPPRIYVSWRSWLRRENNRHYAFEQIAEAHRYVDTGRKKGNVIITLERSVG